MSLLLIENCKFCNVKPTYQRNATNVSIVCGCGDKVVKACKNYSKYGNSPFQSASHQVESASQDAILTWNKLQTK